MPEIDEGETHITRCHQPWYTSAPWSAPDVLQHQHMTQVTEMGRPRSSSNHRLCAEGCAVVMDC